MYTGGVGEGTREWGYFEDVSRKESDFVIRNEKNFHITKNRPIQSLLCSQAIIISEV